MIFLSNVKRLLSFSVPFKYFVFLLYSCITYMVHVFEFDIRLKNNIFKGFDRSYKQFGQFGHVITLSSLNSISSSLLNAAFESWCCKQNST